MTKLIDLMKKWRDEADEAETIIGREMLRYCARDLKKALEEEVGVETARLGMEMTLRLGGYLAVKLQQVVDHYGHSLVFTLLEMIARFDQQLQADTKLFMEQYKPGEASGIKMAIYMVCGEFPIFYPADSAGPGYWWLNEETAQSAKYSDACPELCTILDKLLPNGDPGVPT